MFLEIFFLPILVYYIYRLVEIGIFYYKYYIKKSDQLNVKTFVPSTYALVTGATDGIGKAMCFKLASEKMNLIILGRGEKLINTKKELRIEHPEIQVQAFEIDFSEKKQYEALYNNAEFNDLLKNNKITVLVNNVGVSSESMDFFDCMSQEKIHLMIMVNCFALSSLTAFLLSNNYIKENGTVINVSSTAGQISQPYLSLYSATKKFVDHLTSCLVVEYADKFPKMKFHVVNPGMVSTKMSKMKPNVFCPTAKEYARSVLNYVGELGRKHQLTGVGGFLAHDVCLLVFKLIPGVALSPLLRMAGRKFKAMGKKGN